MAAVIEQTEPDRLLDALFDRFTATLAQTDAEYADLIGLETLSADTFADGYFAERDRREPLVWARRNLEKSRRNHASKYVVRWRYAILQCHEAFGVCADELGDEELKRFNRGMKRVFADNYAAIPPLSIERLLALHDAGLLSIAKLDRDYDLEVDEVTGRSTVTGNGEAMSFDVVFDARGQAVADEDEFPFPTLRMVLKANRDLDVEDNGGAVRIDPDYRLAGGANPLRDVWCLSLPFLLDRKPFIQGPTSASDMGSATAEAILADITATPMAPDATLATLVDVIAATQPVMLADGAVVLAPKGALERMPA